MTLFVFGGKFLGGFVCDRLGAGKTALLSLPLAAALVAFGSNWMAPSLLGQLLLNLTMPVTLLLIYRILPEHPAFGFGLAASVLWPGAIAASYIKLSGPALAACIILAFLFGLAAIIVTDKKLCKRRNEK
jgi:FSR family fosmidomycin resistance protein-like MFS transporter